MVHHLEKYEHGRVDQLLDREKLKIELNAWRTEALRLSLQIDHIFDAAKASEAIMVGNIKYVPEQVERT